MTDILLLAPIEAKEVVADVAKDFAGGTREEA